MDLDLEELTERLGGGFVSAVTTSPATEATAFVWTPRRYPMWNRLGIVQPDGEIVLTSHERRLWGRPQWSPSGRLCIGGFVGIGRVVFEIDIHTASAQLLAGGAGASYELLEYLEDGSALCRRRALDGSIDVVRSHADGPDSYIRTEQSGESLWPPSRLITWHVGGLRLEGILIPPQHRDPPWETVTFLHGGPVGALAIGAHDRVGAWSDPRRATFIPEFPASGVCGEAAMLAAFQAPELPDEDHEVDAVLAGIDTLVSSGIAREGRLFLVGHSYGAYLVNRALTGTDRFRAAVCWEGVADLRSLDPQSLVFQASWRGGSPQEVPERWSAASPIDRAARVRTPVLLYYGGSGPLVAQGERWYGALQEAGVMAKLVVDDGVGHTFDNERGAARFHQLVDGWFSDMLDG